MKLLKIFSYGGGVQSNAVLVLAAQQRVFYDAFVFANVGENAENPATLDYIENYAKPYAAQAGIPFYEVKKTNRKGEIVDLYDYTMSSARSIPIPVIMPSSGAFANRACTFDWKIAQIDKWAKSRGATRWITGLGISMDEITRMRSEQWQQMGKSERFKKRVEYPLIDLRFNRGMCQKIIQQAGLPLPPKSSCFFCPFKKRNEWIEMKREKPDLFAKAVALDEKLAERFKRLGRGRGAGTCAIHQSGGRLAIAVADQPLLFPVDEMEACESGYCMI